MTTTVFLIILICLLTMRFFFTCMIVLLIGVFILANQPSAHATPAAKCNPTFITLDSIYTRASIVCPVDYMDSQVGQMVHNISLPCWNELPRSTINNLIKKGFDAFNEDVKANGKPEACKKAGQTQEFLISE